MPGPDTDASTATSGRTRESIDRRRRKARTIVERPVPGRPVTATDTGRRLSRTASASAGCTARSARQTGDEPAGDAPDTSSRKPIPELNESPIVSPTVVRRTPAPPFLPLWVSNVARIRRPAAPLGRICG